MPKCQVCGKKGLFLKLTNGLCASCLSVAQHQIAAVRSSQNNPMTSNKYAFAKEFSRAEHTEIVQQQKSTVDQVFSSNAIEINRQLCAKAINSAALLDADLVIMDAHGSVCSECAKYQGRVYSISGRSKVFPKVPHFFYSSYGVHPGCSHIFSPYIHGVDNPDLAYTLAVHPLKDPRYGTDIITFSNRPFVDDRTDECKAAAEEVLRGETREEKCMREFEERMKELEAKKEQEEQDYYWLCMNFPDKCPKSVTGYRRMKTQNTKNFQILKALAAKLGREL